MGDFVIAHKTEDQGPECKRTCPGCAATHRRKEQRIASATIAASIDEVIALLEHHNLKAAESYAIRLLETVGKAPAATPKLAGPEVVKQLLVRLSHGLLEIRNAGQLQALGTFRSTLRWWFDSYPSHRA